MNKYKLPLRILEVLLLLFIVGHRYYRYLQNNKTLDIIVAVVFLGFLLYKCRDLFILIKAKKEEN